MKTTKPFQSYGSNMHLGHAPLNVFTNGAGPCLLKDLLVSQWGKNNTKTFKNTFKSEFFVSRIASTGVWTKNKSIIALVFCNTG